MVVSEERGEHRSFLRGQRSQFISSRLGGLTSAGSGRSKWWSLNDFWMDKQISKVMQISPSDHCWSVQIIGDLGRSSSIKNGGVCLTNWVCMEIVLYTPNCKAIYWIMCAAIFSTSNHFWWSCCKVSIKYGVSRTYTAIFVLARIPVKSVEKNVHPTKNHPKSGFWSRQDLALYCKSIQQTMGPHIWSKTIVVLVVSI